MKTIIVCDGCGQELPIVDANCGHLDELRIKVIPCLSRAHYDCSDCEDLAALKQTNEQLEKERNESMRKLNDIRKILKGE